jgi:heat shock protein HslJ
VRIVIDVQEMRIHGNSGCNLFNGTLFIDPYKDWGVEFQELVSTRKMCRNIHIETALLVALEETQFCKELENGEIALFDGNGNQIATLKRLNLK